MSWFGWGEAQTIAHTVPAPVATAPLGTSGYLQTGTLGYGGASDGGKFGLREIVEYFSVSQNAWILATVIGINPDGTYNLDCKPQVPPDKIRRRSTATGPLPTTLGTTTLPPVASNVVHNIGEIVEYYSTSMSKWIPAQVLRANPNGSYDLDCKASVLPDKIRSRSTGAAKAPSSLASNNLISPSTPALASAPSTPKKTEKIARQPQVDSPVQLLRVQQLNGRWRYEICEEGADLLERHGSRRIAVASICGLYRTGKSFLLNLLLDRVQKGLPRFKVGATTNACTEGLWLWGSTDSSDEQSPLLAFIDCEGFGCTTSDRTRDAQLMTLCTLLSSVLVLNTRGQLNEGLFNSLAATCRFAEHIEERGQEASRPVLLWVLRDFMLELRDEFHRPITPDEYLEKQLHAAPVASGDQSRGQAARDVRQSLLKFFSHRSCATLVQPAVEEAQLQQLNSLPYSSLRSEFRAGVEALKTQLVAICHANPKAVGGQLLGCNSFVALAKHLANALNDNKVLSMKGAWETVQHSACASLADELRLSACGTLRELVSGQQLRGGAQLPMTSESLYTVLRDKRHTMKAQWLERAVGDEAVRKEYWQDLKDTLLQEEAAVRQQNARVADQQLQYVLDRWQAWLDDDTGVQADGEKIAEDLALLVERVPAAPLSRAGRQAVEAAARRIRAVRTSLAAVTDHATTAQRKATQWGEQASMQAGAARTELESKHADLVETIEALKKVFTSHETSLLEYESKRAELESVREELKNRSEDVRAVQSRIRELSSNLGTQALNERTVQAELEQARADAAKAEAERVASEESSEAASKLAIVEKERLEAALNDARSQFDSMTKASAAARDSHTGRCQDTVAEHSRLVEDVRKRHDEERNALQGEHTKTKEELNAMIAEWQKKLEDLRSSNAKALEVKKTELLQVDRQTGLLDGQVQALSHEATALRERVAELQETIRETEARGRQHAREAERLHSELEQHRLEAKNTHAETEEHLKVQGETFQRSLDERFFKDDKAKPRCGCILQ